MNDINKMPPTCQYCPYWEVCKYPWVCPDIGDKKPKRTEERTETHACDLISRQAAIDALENIDCSDGIGISALKCDVVEDAINAINALPPAQPERKRGKWIDYIDEGYVECPFCHSATNCDGNKDELHFCFSCGADMREVDE